MQTIDSLLFIYQPTPKIISGTFDLGSLRGEIRSGKVLICSSKSVIEKTEVQNLLNNLGRDSVKIFASVNPNPSFEDVNTFLPQAREFKPDVLIAIGGGSVIDFTKVIGLAVSNTRVNTAEELQGVDIDHQRSIQIVAIPTTCGTGAEVTPFATIWDKVNNVKCSIEHPLLRPDLVVIDGRLSSSSSNSQILFSGLDAVSHCVETLWNKHRNSWSSSFAVSGITSILEVFPKILSGSGSDHDWQIMQESALFAGLAISQNHTAIAHAISYPLTANFQVPHGLACSFSIPNIWRSLSASTKSEIKNFDLINDAAAFIDSLLLDQIMAKYVSDLELYSVAEKMISPDRAGNFIEKIDALWIEKFLDTFHQQ